MTTKAEAVRLFDLYMQRHDSVNLDDREQAIVIRKLQWLNSADIDDVVRVVEETQENNMYRGEAQRPESTQQQKQSIKEVSQIIEYFIANYWGRYTQAVPPTENGQKKSAINYQMFGTAVRNRFNEGKRIGHDILGEIVLSLDQQKLLEHPPAVVERIVEVEKPVPLSAEALANRDIQIDRTLNAREGDAIRGRGAQTRTITRQEVLAEATQYAESDQAAKNIIEKIGNHRGKSRGATEAEKEILEGVLATGREANTPWVKIEAQIDAKQTEMKSWDATQAIRVTMAEKAARKNINMMERPKNPYGPEAY